MYIYYLYASESFCGNSLVLILKGLHEIVTVLKEVEQEHISNRLSIRSTVLLQMQTNSIYYICSLHVPYCNA